MNQRQPPRRSPSAIRRPPVPRRRWWPWTVALLILLIAGTGAVFLRLYGRGPGAITPRAGPLQSIAPVGMERVDPSQALDYQILNDEWGTFNERRVLRRSIAMSSQASREAVRSTMVKAFSELGLVNRDVELVILWAIPSPRLLQEGILFATCNLFLGEMIFAADSKGYHGQQLPAPFYFKVLVPDGTEVPGQTELDRYIDVCRALQRARPKTPERSNAITEQVAHRHGLKFEQMLAITGKVRTHYPSLPPDDVKLRD